MKSKKYICNKSNVCGQAKKCEHGEEHTQALIRESFGETFQCTEKHTMCLATGYDCVCEEV